MQAKDVIKLFDHLRHDRMNDLQLLKAYASMGKTDNLQEKMQELAKKAEHERRLSNLEIPETALWLIRFNWDHTNVRLEYEVELDNKHLSVYDETILNLSRRVVDIINFHAVPDEMYSLLFRFREAEPGEADVEINMKWKGLFNDPEIVIQQLRLVSDLEVNVVIEETDETVFTVSWQCKK